MSLMYGVCPRYQIGHPIHPHRVMRHLTITDVPDDIDDDPIWKEAPLANVEFVKQLPVQWDFTKASK